MKVAITTTIPVEAIFAAGHTPVDIKNIFVLAKDPAIYLEKAHNAGLPRNFCAWVKAEYSIVQEQNFGAVVAVVSGDCSNTNTISELLIDEGVVVHPFSYPHSHNGKNSYPGIVHEIDNLADALGATKAQLQDAFRYLEPIRNKLTLLDDLTVSGQISGLENHLWLVTSSDFNTDPVQYEKELDELLYTAKNRQPREDFIRLGLVGVPPIITNLYDFVKEHRADFVFNEVQRQFSIPSRSPDIYQRYLDYTFPYSVFHRIDDINKQSKRRRLDGIIHYVQSFCHRQVQDTLMRKHINLPILTIEADSPGDLDERSKIRIESFIEMLIGRKK